MKPWKRIDPTEVTKVGWRKVTSKTFVMPDGEKAVFDVLHPDGQSFVNVIALTPENQVIITRQFRPGPEMVMDDLPGGFVDPGETPEQAIKREFVEETGYEVGSLRYLGKYHKDTYMNAIWHTFMATDCAKIKDQELETEEFIEVTLLSVEEFLKTAKDDGMTDHAAVLMAYDELLKLKENQ
jgi:ADP-ribose pyrophosphatase